ncbi:hypothetical protein [Bacillus sp. FJAT-22090]|uniref:hypothetical protein n=1 Tax=Bacillus sp. FJAT-22090 TaxID=1581038 RepID=UPI000A9F01E6|nr:hypothetical protein [Bacillus sp. FJAT-22090]
MMGVTKRWGIMRNKKTLCIIIVTLLLLIIVTSLQLSKTIKIEDLLTEEFLYDDTNIIVESINGVNFEEINLPDHKKKELISLFENAELNEAKEQYSPLDAEYKIYTKVDQIYIFVEENVIVFPKKNIKSYKVINNDSFIEEIEEILQ